MIRVVVCASVVVLASALVGCSGHDASVVDDSTSSTQKLQTKKDGSPTGDGKSCTWENTTTFETCSSPKAPVPTYSIGDEFKSIDGCNECACTAKGIMCTVRACNGGGGTPPDPGSSGGIAVPPQPYPGDPVCTADALKCPDGSWVARGGPKCDFGTCGAPPGTGGGGTDPDPGSSGGVACPAVARVCKGNLPAKTIPGTCEQICPEDPTPPSDPKDPVACTADAMKCPDGTVVGRTGPKCEFICPTTK